MDTQLTDNRTIPGPAGTNLPIRVYTPAGNGPFPVLLYFHGGGFVVATIDTYNSSCSALANGADCVVVSVEYRKAPENKYPAAVDGAFAAYLWVRANTGSISGDPARIAVGGESAGGNLATVTAMQAIEKNVIPPVFQLLVYPVVNSDVQTESYKSHANAKPLNKAMMEWFFGHYLADKSSRMSDPHVVPLQAKELEKLPPAMIITSEIDPLKGSTRRSM